MSLSEQEMRRHRNSNRMNGERFTIHKKRRHNESSPHKLSYESPRQYFASGVSPNPPPSNGDKAVIDYLMRQDKPFYERSSHDSELKGVIAKDNCLPLVMTGNSSNFHLEEILQRPIQFVEATSLTFNDERILLRKAQAVRTNSSTYTKRQRFLADAKVSKTWPSCVLSRPKGLGNPSALCYRRSVLQTLLHLPAFINWLNPTLLRTPTLDHKHTAAYPNSSESCLLCKIRDLAASCWTKTSTAETDLSLRWLDRAITISGKVTTPRWRYVSSYIQADAHEFLGWLLEVFETYFSEPQEIIRNLFKIRIESEWKCSYCLTIHTGPGQDELGLQLPLGATEQSTLMTYIKAVFTETIHSVRCDTCQLSASRTRTRTISAAPEILIVQLQRFQRTQNAFTGRIESKKISKHVAITESLDLSVFASEKTDREAGMLKYRLSSVVHHCGSLNNGHYINIARSPAGSVWKLDDEDVRESHLVDMLEPGKGWTPYLLTYIAE